MICELLLPLLSWDKLTLRSISRAFIPPIFVERHCLELLDGSVSPSRSGSRECRAVENITRSRRRCRPRPGTCRLQGFLHALERRRPRHSHLQTSQDRGCKSAVVEEKPSGDHRPTPLQRAALGYNCARLGPPSGTKVGPHANVAPREL